MIVPDPSKMYMGSGMVESKSVGTFSHLQRQDSHRGLFVDRGVGSPRLVKSASTSTFFSDLKLDTESKVCFCLFHLSISQVTLFIFCVSCLLICRIQCQQQLELLPLQLLPIKCLDQRRIGIWQLSWYFSLNVLH